MSLVLALLRLANIIHNHLADFLHAVLFLRKVLSEGGRADFGQMLLLCDCEYLRLGQAAGEFFRRSAGRVGTAGKRGAVVERIGR